jgi:hypothetical protein
MWACLKAVLKRIIKIKDRVFIIILLEGWWCDTLSLSRSEEYKKMSSFENRLQRKIFRHKADETRRAVYL